MENLNGEKIMEINTSHFNHGTINQTSLKSNTSIHPPLLQNSESSISATGSALLRKCVFEGSP